MPKKAQLSAIMVLMTFFLIAILVLVSFRGFSSRDNVIGSIQDINTQAVAFRSYMEGCIDNHIKGVLYVFGMQGGAINLQSPYLTVSHDNESVNIAFLYYEGNVSLQLFTEWKSLLALEISNQIEYCTASQDLSNFRFNASEPTVSLYSGGEYNNATIVDIELPIVLYVDGASHALLDNYTYSYPLNLLSIYDDVLAVMVMEYYDPYSIDFTFLNALNTSIQSAVYDDVIVYTIMEPGSNLDGDPYQFNFANKFNHTWVPRNESA